MQEQKKPSSYDEFKGPTFNLFIINVLFFIVTVISPNTRLILGLSIPSLAHGLFWTPITSVFTHANFAHIGGNMIFLLVYGFRLEEERNFGGKAIYGGYLITGVLAGLLSAPLLGNALQVGSSGSVFGLLGINVGVERKLKNPNYKKMIYSSIILFLLATGPSTNIFGHLFGLIIGIIVGQSDYYNQLREIDTESLK